MTWQLLERPRETLVICSVDTEEDNWEPQRDGVTANNVDQLPRLGELMGELNAPVTYFVTHAVAANGASCRVLRKLVDQGNSEIGAHLHPWNTPPLTESISPPNLMLNNLPASLQFSKLQHLTDRLEDALGQTPVSFRAGRSGLGASTVDVIRRCGYTIDSSVMPFHDLCPVHGPNFVGAPNRAYCIGENGNAREPLVAGPILEIPVPGTSPFVRSPGDRDRLLARIRGVIEGLRHTAPVRFVTLSQAATSLARKGP